MGHKIFAAIYDPAREGDAIIEVIQEYEDTAEKREWLKIVVTEANAKLADSDSCLLIGMFTSIHSATRDQQ